MTTWAVNKWVYIVRLQIIITWSRGPMDKASAHGARDCRLESCRDHIYLSAQKL